ncbi:MAG: hypothetical protein Q9211_000933 [Gyalolechia sp. 1 TL-2023]
MRLVIILTIIGAGTIATPGIGAAQAEAVENYGDPGLANVAHDKTTTFNSLSASASTADETSVSSITTDTDLTTNDEPDKNEDLATKCVRTSEGSLQCGATMAHRGDPTRLNVRVAARKNERHLKERQASHRVEIPGWGTCDIFYRNYYYDNDSNDTHASKCKKELKKGPAKWRKSQMLKCYDIPRGVCFRKRDAIVDPQASDYGYD